MYLYHPSESVGEPSSGSLGVLTPEKVASIQHTVSVTMPIIWGAVGGALGVVTGAVLGKPLGWFALGGTAAGAAYGFAKTPTISTSGTTSTPPKKEAILPEGVLPRAPTQEEAGPGKGRFLYAVYDLVWDGNGWVQDRECSPDGWTLFPSDNPAGPYTCRSSMGPPPYGAEVVMLWNAGNQTWAPFGTFYNW